MWLKHRSKLEEAVLGLFKNSFGSMCLASTAKKMCVSIAHVMAN